MPRTDDDERQDVLAHLRSKLASYARTFRGMPADLGTPRDNLAAQIVLLDAVLIDEIAHGAHVGTAEHKETP